MAHPSMTHPTASEAPRSSPSIYSYTYEHMVARIMAFQLLQQRVREGNTEAENRRSQWQRPRARRPSYDSASGLGSAGDSSASSANSDYLEAVPIYEPLGDGENETVISNV